MAAFLSNLRAVVITGFVLAAIVLGIHWWQVGMHADKAFWMFFVRWLHAARNTSGADEWAYSSRKWCSVAQT